jgi:DNA-binding MarR family transcriptional regulator
MPSENQDSLESLLSGFLRLHHQRMFSLLAKLGLYPGQPPILAMLWQQDGRTQKELAENRRLAPATVTVMLQRMEKAGLIERRPDPADHRVTRVYLTESGRTIRSEVEAVRQSIDGSCFAGFTVEERVLLRRFLLQMIDNLERTAAE